MSQNKMIQNSTYQRISFISLLFLFFSLVGYSQNCNSKLEVVKNRDSRSLTKKEHTFFDLELINESGKSSTYTITSENLNTNCSNNYSYAKSKGANVALKIEFINSKGQIISNGKIKIDAFRSVKFRVKVSASSKTATDRWSCIRINATSDECKTASSEATLKAFVANDSNY